jgi:ribosomal protein S17E
VAKNVLPTKYIDLVGDSAETTKGIVVEKCTIVGKTDLVGNIAGYLTGDFCCAATLAKSTLLETLAEKFVAINLYYHKKNRMIVPRKRKICIKFLASRMDHSGGIDSL